MEAAVIFIIGVLVLLIISFIVLGFMYQFNLGPYSYDYVAVDPRTGEVPTQPWTTPVFNYGRYEASEPAKYIRDIYEPFEYTYCQQHPGQCTEDNWSIPAVLVGKREYQYPYPDNL